MAARTASASVHTMLVGLSLPSLRQHNDGGNEMQAYLWLVSVGSWRGEVLAAWDVSRLCSDQHYSDVM